GLIETERDGGEAVGCVSGHFVGEQEVVLGFRHAAQQRPHDGGVIARGDTQSGVPVDDARIACCDRDVCQQSCHQSCAYRWAMHGGDDDLRAVDDVVDEVTRLAPDACA